MITLPFIDYFIDFIRLFSLFSLLSCYYYADDACRHYYAFDARRHYFSPC